MRYYRLSTALVVGTFITYVMSRVHSGQIVFTAVDTFIVTSLVMLLISLVRAALAVSARPLRPYVARLRKFASEHLP